MFLIIHILFFSLRGKSAKLKLFLHISWSLFFFFTLGSWIFYWDIHIFNIDL